jgi:NAD(P)-dependent dehydrogenase (short-subunit alcohol dehydrogenase family)
MNLEGKVALITGGGNGIGRATAIRFAQEGAKIVISDMDENGLELTGRELAKVTAAADGADGNGAFSTVVGDVSSRDDVQKMVDAATGQYGRLDVLINNAGINRDALMVRVKDGETRFMSDEKWDQVLNVNLKGTWLCCQIAALPMMQQKYGRIVNTSSIGALGNIGQANYAASKAGVIGLTRTLALEWARFGIAVNCVAPGATKTQMTAGIPDKILQGILSKIPTRRLAEPEEIAAVHLFLASNEASYITGQVLFTDGGASVGI